MIRIRMDGSIRAAERVSVPAERFRHLFPRIRPIPRPPESVRTTK